MADNVWGPPDPLGGADPIYAGSNAKWQKFANSLRLRYAMRMSNVDQGTAEAEIQAATDEALASPQPRFDTPEAGDDLQLACPWLQNTPACGR